MPVGYPIGKPVGFMGYKYRHQEWYKDKKIDVKAHTRTEMMEKVIKKKQQIDSQTVDAGMPLADFCTLYLKTYKRDSVSASWYRDLCALANKLVAGIGNKPVGKIKPIEAQAFLNSQSHLADSTIKKTADFTKQIFSELQLSVFRYMPSVPAFHVKQFPINFPTNKKGLTEASP